jgi:hypothetical protein
VILLRCWLVELCIMLLLCGSWCNQLFAFGRSGSVALERTVSLSSSVYQGQRLIILYVPQPISEPNYRNLRVRTMS